MSKALYHFKLEKKYFKVQLNIKLTLHKALLNRNRIPLSLFMREIRFKKGYEHMK